MFTSGALSLAVLAVVVALLALRRAQALETDRAMLATHLRALSRRIAVLEEAANAASRARLIIGPARRDPDTQPPASASEPAERRQRTIH